MARMEFGVCQLHKTQDNNAPGSALSGALESDFFSFRIPFGFVIVRTAVRSSPNFPRSFNSWVHVPVFAQYFHRLGFLHRNSERSKAICDSSILRLRSSPSFRSQLPAGVPTAWLALAPLAPDAPNRSARPGADAHIKQFDTVISDQKLAYLVRVRHAAISECTSCGCARRHFRGCALTPRCR